MNAAVPASSAMALHHLEAEATAPSPAAHPVARDTGRDSRRGVLEHALVLALVLAAHGTGLFALTRLDWKAAVPPEPIEVALITPPKPIPAPPAPPVEEPKPEPPKPKPPKPKPAPKPPAPKPPPPKPTPPAEPVTESPTALAAPEAPPEPVVAEPQPPAPLPPAAPPAPPAPPPPEPVVAARFDADYLNNPPPSYPPLSRRMQEQGKVMLRVLVTADGQPGKVELSASSGSRRLDSAAMDAVRRWRFVPARQGDRNVEAWVIVPIVFKLEGS